MTCEGTEWNIDPRCMFAEQDQNSVAYFINYVTGYNVSS